MTTYLITVALLIAAMVYAMGGVNECLRSYDRASRKRAMKRRRKLAAQKRKAALSRKRRTGK
jgi:hypothetical protein